jgi:hypothetical protein
MGTEITPPHVLAELAKAHAEIFEREHFYWHGKPQCSQRSIVGGYGGIGGRICVCELVAGHEGTHERVPTSETADAADTVNLPAYQDYRGGKRWVWEKQV